MTISIRGEGRALLPALPLAVLFAVAFIAPLAVLVLLSLFTTPDFSEFGVVQYLRFLTDGLSAGVLLNTLVLGAEVATLSLVLSYPLAVFYCESGRRTRSLVMFAILLPLLTSSVIRTFSWIVILGREGIVNAAMIGLGLWDSPERLLYSWGGLVIALTQIQLPLMALPVINSLLRLDPGLARAAEGLGAGKWRIFFGIVLPLTKPGAIAGWVLVFAAAATAFITQTLIGGGRIVLMPQLIYQASVGAQDWPFAAALSLVFTLAVVVAVTLASRWATRFTGGAHV